MKQKIFPNDLPPGLPLKRLYDHKIELEPGAQPTVRSLSQPELMELRTELDYLLEKKFIRPSTLLYAAPILFTPKKDEGLRMCTDYRALNNIAIKSRYLIPRADDLIDQLHGARIFLRFIYEAVTTSFVSLKLIFQKLPFASLRKLREYSDAVWVDERTLNFSTDHERSLTLATGQVRHRLPG
ncbi:hypothetical protein CLOP_g2284 [Closterium sp. NIES-67]|nr:hypothetical protein CLOP_g2284 [Closterium sp. NIES-67]